MNKRQQLIQIASKRWPGHGAKWLTCTEAEVGAALDSDVVPAKFTAAPVAGDLASVIAAAVAQYMPPQETQLDEEAITALVKTELAALNLGAQIAEAMASQAPKRIEVVANGTTTALTGVQHYRFELLLKTVAAGVNGLMVGPAGSGKTTAAEKVAQALELPFYAMSVGPQTTKSDLLGYPIATGGYATTNFRRAFEGGGVFLFDEIDAGNAAVLTVINAALANGVCGFPDGMVKRHPQFLVLAGANTYGMGANRQYVGRQQLDAATLDRFAVIDWDYDECLEAALIGVNVKLTKGLTLDAGGIPTAADWFARVTRVRAVVENLEIRHVVSPRATIYGMALFGQGIGQDHVEKMLLWRGLEAAQLNRIKSSL